MISGGGPDRRSIGEQMDRIFGNLKLVHKLAVPAIFIIIAGLATTISAKGWLDSVEAKVAAVVDQDAARLDLALTAVGQLNAATVFQRDLLLTTKLEEAENNAKVYRQKLEEVQKTLDALVPLMADAEQRRI